MWRWLLIFGLGLAMSHAEPVCAITFEEFEFKLSEAQRQKEQAARDIEELVEQLDQMKKSGVPAEERKAYSEELIEVIRHTENLDKEIEELKQLLPDMEIRPVLKLTGIEPGGSPGKFSEGTTTSGDLKLSSVRFSSFPTEIVAGRPFTISGDSIWRIRFRENVVCHDQRPGQTGRKMDLSISAYTSMETRTEPAMNSALSGKTPMNRYCSDAPVDIDPESGERLQAGFEKEDRIAFNTRFIPVRAERGEDGKFRFSYRIETMSAGILRDESQSEILIYETTMTNGRGTCMDVLGRECGTILIVLRSSSGGSATLVYQQIMDGQPFLASAPSYEHPAAFGRPPQIGSISLATSVPDIIGYTRSEAEYALEQAQLKISFSPAVHPPSPGLAGKVKSVNPGVGERVRFGRTIAVISYADFMTVPDVVGLTLGEARVMFRENHLEVLSVKVVAATSAGQAEQIVGQLPAGGSRVAPESRIELEIAGPWVDTREVPALIGVTLRQARSRLEQAGLVPVVTIVRARSEREAERIMAQSVAEGTRVEAGTTIHIDLAGPWDAATGPEPSPSLSPNELCSRDFPGSFASENPNANGNWDCNCPSGKKWNRGQTACVVVVSETIPPPASRSSGCDHPWMVLGPDYGGNFPRICECRYGTGINSFACLPPRPPGHTGCPPGTRKEYSMPDRLGLGCECIYGVENRACITNGSGSAASSSANSRSTSGMVCPPGTRQEGGTLGQEATRCVPQ